ncbi:hypothetical protein JTE90_008532 [Oedothorax gibbosus]|uniref:Maturase K n=1 Tax=Oedothorax gibbosus TaxID=931172 RepID=A0AAV6VGP4_9ARAC|nr:hypothetical protein JTE90_008532 [Oedothorax gibbosus]
MFGKYKKEFHFLDEFHSKSSTTQLLHDPTLDCVSPHIIPSINPESAEYQSAVPSKSGTGGRTIIELLSWPSNKSIVRLWNNEL